MEGHTNALSKKTFQLTGRRHTQKKCNIIPPAVIGASILLHAINIFLLRLFIFHPSHKSTYFDFYVVGKLHRCDGRTRRCNKNSSFRQKLSRSHQCSRFFFIIRHEYRFQFLASAAKMFAASAATPVTVMEKNSIR